MGEDHDHTRIPTIVGVASGAIAVIWIRGNQPSRTAWDSLEECRSQRPLSSIKYQRQTVRITDETGKSGRTRSARIRVYVVRIGDENVVTFYTDCKTTQQPVRLS